MENHELEEMKKATVEVYKISERLNEMVTKHKKPSNTEKRANDNVKRILNDMINEIKKIEPEFDVKKAYPDHISNWMKHTTKNTRASVLEDRAKDLLKEVKSKIKEQPEVINENEIKLDKEPKKTEILEKTGNDKTEIDMLQDELKKAAERMNEYRKAGFYAQEAEAHKEYNELLGKINDLKNKKSEEKAPNKENEEEIGKLESELKKAAERMNEYRKAGFYAQEAEAHKEYNELLGKINKLKDKNQKQPNENSLQDSERIGVSSKNPIEEEKAQEKESTPEKPKHEFEEIPQNRALQPLYWEVYNKVATEHCSSPARALYNLSKITVLPWNLDMSTPEKFLSVVGTVYRAPMKLIGYLGTKITGTDKKFAKMKEAVDNLTPEEFSILMDTPEESEKKFGREVKSRNDEFSLTSDTMKQYKHNTLALDAIGTRLKAETNLTLSIIEQQKAERERVSKELIAAREGATPEQQAKIDLALQICNQDIANLVADSKRAVEKNDAFFNGVEHRTSKYKDTEGWILAKFNPDNRTANKEMEKLQRNLLEARQSNDPIAEIEARNALENFGQSQSKTITVGSNMHNKINRGLYSVDRVQTQNMTQQTIGKQILANIATIGCIEKVLTDIHNIRIKDEAIHNNNVNIQNANKYNSNIPYQDSVTKQVDMRQYVQDIDKAEQGMKNVNILASQGLGEHGNLDMSAMETNGSWTGGLNTTAYSARDAALHQATAHQVTSGTLDSSFSLLHDVINKYKPAQQQYAATHNFDYSFMNAMDTNSIDSLNNLFKQLSVPIDVTFDVTGAVSGMQIAEMADIAYKTMTPALMATMITSQSGHLASVAKEKNRAEKEAKRQQKEAEKQQKLADKEAKRQQRTEKQTWNPIVRSGIALNNTDARNVSDDEEIEI